MTDPALPPAIAGALQKAQRELGLRQVDAAAETLNAALVAVPDSSPLLGLAGVVAQMQGRHSQAVKHFRAAIAGAPMEARLHAGLGISLFECGDADGAVAALRRACELAPNVAAGWYNLGKALKLQVQVEEAITALQRALALNPASIPARLTLADSLASVGQLDAAAAEFRRVLGLDTTQAHAWFGLVNLKVVLLTAADVVALRDLFDGVNRPPGDRVLYGFALAKALEDQDDYHGAFRILKRANQLQREASHWDAKAHHAHVGAIVHAFEVPPPVAPGPVQGSEVILIASMPRSGSSLVEQILASHPSVEGANEIADLRMVVEAESKRRGNDYPGWVREASAADWQRLGGEYLARTARWRQRKPRFTDKNLANWQLVGPALAMLPAARVVVVRRDPVETCLACYRQWFSRGTAFAYDLDDLAAYYSDFQKLTNFWLQRYPVQVFDLEYKALVTDPEGIIRRLLEFCGLPFDAACLAPHRTQRAVVSAASAAQVRQPIRADTARAERYGHALDALRERLRTEGA